jgi:hypothetical protein
VSPATSVDILRKRNYLPYQKLNPYNPAHNLVTILIELSQVKKYRSRKTKGEGIRNKKNRFGDKQLRRKVNKW